MKANVTTILRGVMIILILIVLMFDVIVYWDKVFFFVPKPVKNKGMFIIDLPGCKIPKLNPMHVTVSNLIKRIPPLECNINEKPMVVRGHDPRNPSIIITDNTFTSNKSDINCSYRAIRRVNDNKSILDSKIYFMSSLITNVSEEFIRVDCINKQTKQFYFDYFPFIQYKEEVEMRSKRATEEYSLASEKFNVLLLGVDSMARNQFLRHMKKTYTYMKKHLKFVELNGYNKLGSNTYPNLIAMMTGHLESELGDASKVYGNVMPIIWKDFMRVGYKTLYAQDRPSIGAFNYARKGFLSPPVDYYYRPFAIGVEKNVVKTSKFGCFKGRLENEMILNYTLDFYNAFPKDSLFSLTFLARLTHNSLNGLSWHDEPFMRFLQRLKEQGHLNKTFVFFFGDHGFRLGNFRSTYIGRIEEKLPFMVIIMPPWFEQKYPIFYSNLKANSYRLTTLLDINAVLHHILNFNGQPIDNSNPRSRSIDLFRRIVSVNRTCEEARIPLEFCSCLRLEQMKTTDIIVIKAARNLVDAINKITKPHRRFCGKISLGRVTQAAGELVKLGERRHEMASSNYRITIQVKPSGGIFEGIVWYYADKGKFTVFPEIDRINLYGNQSACIDIAKLKPYCYCTDIF